MDNIQDVAVASDLLLVSVPGRGLFSHQLTDTCAGGNDTLNRIGCLGTLDLCDLHKFFQLFRALLQIYLLLTGFLVYGSNQAQKLGIPFVFADLRVIKGSHCLTSKYFPLNYVIY